MKAIRNFSLLLLLAGGMCLSLRAQDKLFTKTGMVSFFSKTDMEDITATNNSVSCVILKSTGDIEIGMLMKAFIFKKALMQEHFNENYVESVKFPKAIFKGKVENISAVKFATDGVYPVKVKGTMTLHGVTKEIVIPGVFTVKGGKVTATAEFQLAPEDYAIKVPLEVRDKIQKQLKVTINFGLAAM